MSANPTFEQDGYRYAETLLKVEKLNATYGDTPVLKNLNLEIRNIERPNMTQGQVIGLLGPSGVGKTTLFRILAGLMEADSGSVLVGPQGEPVHRGMVGVVAQDYPLFAHRTVLANLTVAGKHGKLHEAGQIETKARDLLKQFGLEEHAGKYPAQLSGGQRQRVAIAQQFMCSEYYLLMDEPFSGLDMVAVDRLIKFISEAACLHEWATFILVTHDVAAALEVADTIWLIGRDRDAGGNAIPGARIQRVYDLAERGLAWRQGIANTPEYLQLLGEIRQVFPLL